MSRIVVAVLFASGCGACSSTTEPSGPAASDVSRTERAPNNSNQAQTAVKHDSTNQPGSQEGRNNSSPLAKARSRRDELQRSAPAPSDLNVETLLKRSARPAPENSEFSVALTDTLVERRTFLNHPVLAKVEKITQGNDERKVTVFTRDGRSIDVPGEALFELSTASTVSILKAARLEVVRVEAVERKPRTARPN